MKIISYNVNGIRAAIKKGLLTWLAASDYDVICLQETKANEKQVDTHLLEEIGYHHCWKSAEKKGYSGVAIFSKTKPDQVLEESGLPAYDQEGRIIRADFGDLSVLSVYFPSGSSKVERQAFKMQFLGDFMPYCQALKKERPHLIIAGDYNICHQAIDIHDPIRNKNSSGFLPEERTWMDDWFADGWIDTFRHVHPNQKEQYSWWSYRARSRDRNKGWRIDYISVTDTLKDRIVAAQILSTVKHSDHCPILLEIDINQLNKCNGIEISNSHF